MTTLLSTIRTYRWVLLAAILIFGAKALFILLTPARGLALTDWVIDDAFIEMAVARNIAIGHGFTYDFVHPTTGSPFLWTYMLAIPFWLFGKEGGIHASLILSGFFGMLATLGVYALTERLTGDRVAAWMAFLLSALTANAFFESINGMDTALFTFCVVGAFATYAGVGLPDDANPLKRGLLVGAFVGLGNVVRGDGIFVMGALGLMTLIDLYRLPQKRRDTLRFLAGLVACALVGYVILTGWQYIRTGSPTLANQVGRREISLAWHGFSYANFSLWHYLQIVIWNVFQMEKLLSIASGSALLLLFGLIYALLQERTRRLGLAVTLYLVSFFGALVAYQWYFPDFHGLRYINPAIHLLCVFVGFLVAETTRVRLGSLARSVLVAGMIILSGYAFYDLLNHMPWTRHTSFIGRPSAADEQEMLGLYDWMKENLPPNTVIGVRDHGRPALFTELPIQDLAGNIDPNVPAIIKGENPDAHLRRYFRERNVQYLHIPSLDQRSDALYQVIYRALPLTVVEEAPPTSVRLYRINWNQIPADKS